MTKKEIDEISEWFVNQGGHKKFKEWLNSKKVEKVLKDYVLHGTGIMKYGFDEESNSIWQQAIPYNFGEE